MTMTLHSIRRYPVKAMGGEFLDSVTLTPRGLDGDRWYAVTDGEGKLASGKNTKRFRRHDEVFAFKAATTSTGEVRVSGPGGVWTVGDEALDTELSRAMSMSVRVRPEAAIMHFDAGAVSLIGTATLAWCADRWRLNADPRRLRVNLVVATDEPFIEESWIGHGIRIGAAEITVSRRIQRCRVVDLDQDGVVAEGNLLKTVTANREMMLAVYADVTVPGVIVVGDDVRGS